MPSGGAPHDRAAKCSRPTDVAPVVLLGLIRADGTPVYGVATDMDGVMPRRIGAQRFAFSLTFPRLPLLPGKYLVRAHALDPEGVRLFDNVEMPLLIEGATREMGLVRIDHGWSGQTADSDERIDRRSRPVMIG